jgi:Rad3-related DNA helicase
MSSGGDKDNWKDIMSRINELSKRHYNQKGLIHTSSYSRARKVADSVKSDKHPYLDGNVIVHDKERDPDEQIQDWQESDKDIFLSPSMTSGVSLDDDRCRWQALLKVPYPPMDSRTQYITEELQYGWQTYFERAAIRVVQSYGRAIRNKNDRAAYYILDEDFTKLRERRSFPKWFNEAIDVKEPGTRSVFDY